MNKPTSCTSKNFEHPPANFPSCAPAYRPTPNHLHSYAPHAQTISIYHAVPPQPRNLNPQETVQIHTALPILQRHPTHLSHHHPFCSHQTLQICNLHRVATKHWGRAKRSRISDKGSSLQFRYINASEYLLAELKRNKYYTILYNK